VLASLCSTRPPRKGSGMGIFSDILGTVYDAFKIGFKADLDASGLTAARTYALPDASGTLALEGETTGESSFSKKWSVVFNPDDYLQAADQLGQPVNITMAMWVNVIDVPVLGAFAAVKDAWSIEINTNLTIEVDIRCSTGGVTTVLSPGTIPSNTWVHIAATYDGSTVKLYINGQLVNYNTGGSGDIDYSIDPTTGLVIGLYNSTNSLHGSMDDIFFYSVALTQEDIQSLMNNTFDGGAPTANLLAHWEASTLAGDLGDSVSAWSDSSGNDNDLTQATGGNQPFLWQSYRIAVLESVVFEEGPIAAKTNDYTLESSDRTILADATSNDVVLTLPDAGDVEAGKLYEVVRIDGSANNVSIVRSGTNTIIGDTEINLTEQWTSVAFKRANSSLWVLV